MKQWTSTCEFNLRSRPRQTGTPPEIFKSLNEDERAGWTQITTLDTISKASYAKIMGYDARKAQRHLKRFVDLGLLRRRGSGKATAYEVVR